MALVVVLGVVLVVLARGSRDPLTSPTTKDHWHSAYTIYNCGEVMPVFQGVIDPDGIHSHGDSIIHIHPFNSSATGDDARLGVFLETMNASITRDGIFAENGEFPAILASDGCDGEDAVVKVARWKLTLNNDPELIEVFDDDFDDIRLLANGEGFSFALVPEGLEDEEIPPPLPETIETLRGVGTDLEWEGDPPGTEVPVEGVEIDGEPIEVDPIEVEVPVEGGGVGGGDPIDPTEVETPDGDVDVGDDDPIDPTEFETPDADVDVGGDDAGDDDQGAGDQVDPIEIQIPLDGVDLSSGDPIDTIDVEIPVDSLEVESDVSSDAEESDGSDG